MATILRDPLYVNRRGIPPGQHQNPDTSRGTPKTLIADAQMPVGAQWHRSAPPYPHTVVDTSRGVPKGLFFDAQMPVGAQSELRYQELPRANWLNPDTSQDINPLLFAPPALYPPGQQWTASAPWRMPALPQYSGGPAKTLFADAQMPVGAAHTRSAPWQMPVLPQYPWSTAKVLYADLQMPVGSRIDRSAPWLFGRLYDTTYFTPKTLFGDTQAPVGQFHTRSAPQRPLDVVDTSRSSYPATFTSVIALPPGQASWVADPQWWWRNPQQPTSTPKTLYSDIGLPVGAQWTQSAPWKNPVVPDTTMESPPVAIQNVQPPVDVIQPPPDFGLQPGAGKITRRRGKKRERKAFVEIDGELLPVADSDEALELLERAEELAKAEAPKFAAVAVEKATQEQERRIPTVTLPPPDIRLDPDFEEWTPEAEAKVRAVREAIAKAYAEAIKAELRAARERADEEDVEFLLLNM